MSFSNRKARGREFYRQRGLERELNVKVKDYKTTKAYLKGFFLEYDDIKAKEQVIQIYFLIYLFEFEYFYFGFWFFVKSVKKQKNNH